MRTVAPPPAPRLIPRWWLLALPLVVTLASALWPDPPAAHDPSPETEGPALATEEPAQAGLVTPLSTAHPVTLALRVEPPDALVRINGVAYAAVAGVVQVRGLRSGARVQVQVSAPGHLPIERNVLAENVFLPMVVTLIVDPQQPTQLAQLEAEAYRLADAELARFAQFARDLKDLTDPEIMERVMLAFQADNERLEDLRTAVGLQLPDDQRTALEEYVEERAEVVRLAMLDDSLALAARQMAEVAHRSPQRNCFGGLSEEPPESALSGLTTTESDIVHWLGDDEGDEAGDPAPQPDFADMERQRDVAH